MGQGGGREWAAVMGRDIQARLVSPAGEVEGLLRRAVGDPRGSCSTPHRAKDQGAPPPESRADPGVGSAGLKPGLASHWLSASLSSAHACAHPPIQASARLRLGNPDLREDAVIIHLLVRSLYLLILTVFF